MKKVRNGQSNVSLLTTPGDFSPVVDGDVVAKNDRDGNQKKSAEGLLQWTVEVAVPNGRSAISQRVTVNGDRPTVVDGDIVVFEDLVAGAFADGRNAVLYFAADRVRKIGAVDDNGQRRYDESVSDQLDSILAD